MKPLVRWTIGNVQPAGFDCLARSITAWQKIYDTEIVVCHNNLTTDQLASLCGLEVNLHNQLDEVKSVPPLGVAWKLYPARLSDHHELFIDNDLIIEEKIAVLDRFFDGDHTLLLEGDSRNYGHFDRHVPRDRNINSGIFGIPPGFDFQNQIEFFVKEWNINCDNSSMTWDEQGLVAAVLSSRKHEVIPKTIVTNCELEWRPAAGMHFVSLNRSGFHRPFAEYKAAGYKIY